MFYLEAENQLEINHLFVLEVSLEVRAGIEPTYADLQSATSPFCHRTSTETGAISLLELGGSRPIIDLQKDFSSAFEQAIKD